MNGYELGGGSIRIHESNLQAKIFELLGVGKKAEEKFGFLMNAFKYEHLLMVVWHLDLIELLCF